MSRRVIIRAAAESDVTSAAEWYDAQERPRHRIHF
jgi:hypothetical protein